ncbi:CHAP domain-containing protein [Streptomyces sp. NPDC004533]|uniref:CHAP domain-containing protein n=1 Tax=Streptomyces sp. NPDC004533 TaxID=3154278 RepID=UPI0033AA5B30
MRIVARPLTLRSIRRKTPPGFGRRGREWTLALVTASLLAVLIAVMRPGADAPSSVVLQAAPADYAANDYPADPARPGAPHADSLDRWGFFTGECTSFVAWRIRQHLGVPDFTNGYHGGLFGYAWHWADNADVLGLPVDATPTPGSVAVFPPNTAGAGPLGHVAVVLSVSPAGTALVEDYNWRDAWDNYQEHAYSQHTVPTAQLQFIHFRPPSPSTPRPSVKPLTMTPKTTAPVKRPAPAAQQQPRPHVFHVYAPAGLSERAAPTLSAPIRARLAAHTAVTVTCQTTGDRVFGTGDSSTVWDRLADGGYATDYWIDTPTIDGFSPGIPRC